MSKRMSLFSILRAEVKILLHRSIVCGNSKVGLKNNFHKHEQMCYTTEIETCDKRKGSGKAKSGFVNLLLLTG